MDLTLPDDCKEFQDYYDGIQAKISKLSILDELLAGVLWAYLTLYHTFTNGFCSFLF